MYDEFSRKRKVKAPFNFICQRELIMKGVFMMSGLCIRGNSIHPVGIYLLKVNNRNTRAKEWNMLKVNNTICQWRLFGVFIVNFEHIPYLCSSVSIVNFEHLIASWAVVIFILKCFWWRFYAGVQFRQNLIKYCGFVENRLSENSRRAWWNPLYSPPTPTSLELCKWVILQFCYSFTLDFLAKQQPPIW